MTKKQVWESLDTGWRRAFRNTVRRWMRHVQEGGYWERAGRCHLCVERKRRRENCRACPIPRFLGFMACATARCVFIPQYAAWANSVEAGRSCLGSAKKCLRWLLAFLPTTDKLRKEAEKLLKAKKR